MSDFDINKLLKDVHTLAGSKIEEVARGVERDLRQYALKAYLKNKTTGDLFRNIKLTETKKNLRYKVDGGKRSNYKNKTYHPITFFVHKDGQKALTEVLQKARKKLK